MVSYIWGEQILDTAVLAKGDVRALIEVETAVRERRRVTAVIAFFSHTSPA
jgi:hypothetical protein